LKVLLSRHSSWLGYCDWAKKDKDGFMKKIAKIIYRLVVAALLFCAGLLVVFTFPLTGNFKFFVVQSGSMAPAVRTGSVVMVKPSAEYQAGDIITFGQNSRTKPPTTHRIVSISNNNGALAYTTKGDANNAADLRTIQPGEIIGRVLFSLPLAGYAVVAARQPYGFFLIIVVPALFIIYDEAVRIRQEIKKKSNK